MALRLCSILHYSTCIRLRLVTGVNRSEIGHQPRTALFVIAQKLPMSVYSDTYHGRLDALTATLTHTHMDIHTSVSDCKVYPSILEFLPLSNTTTASVSCDKSSGFLADTPVLMQSSRYYIDNTKDESG